MIRPLRRCAALAGAASLLAGCATLPQDRSITCEAAGRPVFLSADGRTASLRLDVLTYNIEGLGWPARRGRAAELREIGQRLAALRATGAGPDVVLFQEVFSGAAVNAVDAAGYPAQAAGPGRRRHRDLPSAGPRRGAGPGRGANSA